jgi:hypothetical protein
MGFRRLKEAHKPGHRRPHQKGSLRPSGLHQPTRRRHAAALLNHVAERVRVKAVICDKQYLSRKVRECIRALGAKPLAGLQPMQPRKQLIAIA